MRNVRVPSTVPVWKIAHFRATMLEAAEEAAQIICTVAVKNHSLDSPRFFQLSNHER